MTRRSPFAASFLQAEGPSRPPLISIGTHHRTFTIDTLTDAFLKAEFPDRTRKRNVLSLGAGSDTRFWRLRRRWEAEHPEAPWPVAKWVEVDFDEPARRKAARINADAGLAEWAGADETSTGAADAMLAYEQRWD